MTYPAGNTNNPRARAEKDDARAESEAWQEGKRPLPHVGHDPQFLHIYDGHGNVTLVDLEDGTESRAFRVHYEEREQQEWQRQQKELRS